MQPVKEAITVLMILIPLGSVPRVIYCLCKIMGDPDQEYSMKRRIKNLVTFVVIAECALSLITLFKNYF